MRVCLLRTSLYNTDSVPSFFGDACLVVTVYGLVRAGKAMGAIYSRTWVRNSVEYEFNFSNLYDSIVCIKLLFLPTIIKILLQNPGIAQSVLSGIYL